MILTDGKKTVKITMHTWDGTDKSPDWSHDFFSAGLLPYDEETDTHSVPDVDYCIEQAEDWKLGRGDFYDPDIDVDPDNNLVFVEDI